MASAVEEGEDPYSPWSQLPVELLHIISQKLADNISDFIRFRCVCRSWRHAAKPSYLPRQPPWLLLPYDPESSSRSFFSFAGDLTRTIPLPETLNQIICGSSNGWLIMHDKALNTSLFNPITRPLIRLPPIISLPGNGYFRIEETFPGDVRVVDAAGVEATLEKLTHWIGCFAFVSSDPESVNPVDGVVALMEATARLIQYCKLGDAGWTVLDPGLGYGINTMSFHKGNFYFVDSEGRTNVYELGPAKMEAVVIPPANHQTCHYFTTLRDELLLVSCQKSYINHSYFVFNMFEHHKLEVGSGGMMTWSRIGGAGDCSVFLADGMAYSKERLRMLLPALPGAGRTVCITLFRADTTKAGFLECKLSWWMEDILAASTMRHGQNGNHIQCALHGLSLASFSAGARTLCFRFPFS